MINTDDIAKVKHWMNTDTIRRLLIKYFIEKGFENSFDRQINPILIQDIIKVIPLLTTKIEIIPNVEELDSTLGKAILAWNLFVLGNNRMYLGSTYHNNLSDLAMQIRANNPITMHSDTVRRATTPRKIITFITRVLSDHEQGYVDLNPVTKNITQPGDGAAARHAMVAMPQQFFSRPFGNL